MRILDVGQCGFDGPRMEGLWRARLGAQVDRVATGPQALALLAEEGDAFDLMLVNRELAADGSSGLAVIDAVRKAGYDLPIMLVSDREDAQDEAVSHGALRGFGKAKLGDNSTLDRVREVAGEKA